MISFLLLMLTGLYARHDRLRREEGGASVLEWAMIAAISVALIAAIAVVITRVVDNNVSRIDSCGDGSC